MKSLRFNLKKQPKWRKSSWHTTYEKGSLRWFEGFEAELRNLYDSHVPHCDCKQCKLIMEILGE